jgi:YHS domain-containing protein
MTTHQHARTPADVVDPVCGMTISPDDAVGHVTQKAQT